MADVDKRPSVIDEEEARAERLAIRPLSAAAALGVLLCILALPAFYRPTLYGKLPFDRQLLGEINRKKPDYVFIGNSMLGTRIDEKTLEAHLGVNCCDVIWTGGAESAWEHQVLKNVVAAAEHRPKVVFVFFRDVYLTRVTYRTNGAYWWKIERMSHESEPELMQAMRASRSWQDNLEYDFGLLYPLQKRREVADYGLEWLAGQAVAPGRVPYGAPVAGRYSDLFSLDKLKGVEAADDAASGPDDSALYDFAARLPQSLLPSMVKVAKDAGIKLVFVRVQRRPLPDGPPPQSAQLTRYIGALQRYLAGEGVGYYDFTGDPELTLDRYLDGDHIRADWKPQSTDLFLRRLESQFR
jgi:hypothetical protein